MYVVHQLTNYLFSYRFLATGESFRSLAFAYRLGRKTVADSVYMTCRAIVNRMMETQMPRPSEAAWTDIAERFWGRWQFPNCIGAIDGVAVSEIYAYFLYLFIKICLCLFI